MTGTATPSTLINPTGNLLVDGVLSDSAWSGPVITYAFPTTASAYQYGDEPSNGFFTLSAGQKTAALFFLEQSSGSASDDAFSLEGFTLLTVDRGSDTDASVRLAGSASADPTAYAYYPGDYAQAGDVWLGSDYAAGADRTPRPGSYAWHTIGHELGHALGLKHGHEAEANGTLPADANSVEFSIMTYKTFIGDSGDGYTYGVGDAPQSFMSSDIAALQAMYGADYGVLAGNTVYRWTPGSGATVIDGETAIAPDANRIFATIWDGGGVDTFDLTAYRTDLSIDLRAGRYSMFSSTQLADLGGGPNDGHARGNIFNALLYQGNTASLIENVRSGSGNDRVVGNEAGNTLWGNGGRDTLLGLAGDDTLVGGAGGDRLDGGTGSDTASYAGATAGVTASLAKSSLNKGFAAGDLFTSIENLTGSAFADGLSGNAAANRLAGGNGNDKLSGSGGNDILIGGLGKDMLTGGAGADVFVYLSWTDSKATPAARDTITDFSGRAGDRIDLSTIDADIGLDGFQHFTYIGGKSFTHTGGELRIAQQTTSTFVYGDIDGDGKTDLALQFDHRLTFEKDYFLV